jgi:hypothetical protein
MGEGCRAAPSASRMLNARSTAWTEAAGNPVRSLAASVAATNKCLTQSDKSDVGLKATKKRVRSVLQGRLLGLGDIVNLLFIWLGFAIVVGIAAAHRGRNGAAWLLLAVVTSPLIAGLLLLVLPDPNKERQQQELLKTARKCPLCAELVRREAIVCKHAAGIFRLAAIIATTSEQTNSKRHQWLQALIADTTTSISRMALPN